MTLLQQKIRESELSNTDIAHALQMSEATLWRKASGKSEIKPGEMMLLSHLLSLNEEEIKQIKSEGNIRCKTYMN